MQRTFGGCIDVDGFTRLYDLRIQKKKVTFEGEDGTFENHFGCCTFATRRKNEKKNIPRIELSFAQKNKWEDDWLGHWFYVKTEMAGSSSDEQAGFPFTLL